MNNPDDWDSVPPADLPAFPEQDGDATSPTVFTLCRYLAGSLAPAEAQRIEALLLADPTARLRLERIRQRTASVETREGKARLSALRERIQSLFQSANKEPLAEASEDRAPSLFETLMCSFDLRTFFRSWPLSTAPTMGGGRTSSPVKLGEHAFPLLLRFEDSQVQVSLIVHLVKRNKTVTCRFRLEPRGGAQQLPLEVEWRRNGIKEQKLVFSDLNQTLTRIVHDVHRDEEWTFGELGSSQPQ